MSIAAHILLIPANRVKYGLALPHTVIRTTPAFKICSVLLGMVTVNAKRGDNALGSTRPSVPLSVRLSVRVFVSTLLAEPFDLRS